MLDGEENVRHYPHNLVEGGEGRERGGRGEEVAGMRIEAVGKVGKTERGRGSLQRTLTQSDTCSKA